MISKCTKCNGSKLVKRMGGMYAKCNECNGVGHVKVEEHVPEQISQECAPVPEKVVIQTAPRAGKIDPTIIQRAVDSVSSPTKPALKGVYKGRKQGSRAKTA